MGQIKRPPDWLALLPITGFEIKVLLKNHRDPIYIPWGKIDFSGEFIEIRFIVKDEYNQWGYAYHPENKPIKISVENIILISFFDDKYEEIRLIQSPAITYIIDILLEDSTIKLVFFKDKYKSSGISLKQLVIEDC